MKEIIIDGVNVSGCCFYNNGKCNNPNGMACNCINNAVCYFKELKRLEQENERLKFKLDTVEADYEASEIEIENLKNKLNFLKTANKHLLELDKYRQKELETKAEATKSNIHNLALLSKANKTLQEIKAIAEPFAKCYTHTCRNCEKYDSAHACCLKDINCYKYNDGSKSSCIDFVLPIKQFYQQILANIITKITKAEEE